MCLNWVDQKTQEAIYGNIRVDKNHMIFLMKDSGQGLSRLDTNTQMFYPMVDKSLNPE